MARRKIDKAAGPTPEKTTEMFITDDGTVVTYDEVYVEILDAVAQKRVSPDEINVWHVLPSSDQYVHSLTPEICWCAPLVEEEDGGFIIVHNASDGREDYETGKRKVN